MSTLVSMLLALVVNILGGEVPQEEKEVSIPVEFTIEITQNEICSTFSEYSYSITAEQIAQLSKK